jgi:predicted nucleotidyltransferase/biotin operon repressor
MLQKRNEIEILALLQSAPMHGRKIASTLGTVPSTVLRTLKRLEEEGIVHSTIEGKNTTYHLSDTIDAEIALRIVEHHKLLALLQQPELRAIIKALREQTVGELIVLYGSHANGTATRTSDIDIYVQTESRTTRERLQQLSPKLSIKIGTLEKNSAFARELIRTHVIIQNVDAWYRQIHSL